MAKRAPHWVKLFLRGLERTGNVRLAAEQAGIDFTTAYQRRRRHAEFAEAWERARGAFAEAPPALTLPPPSAAPSLSRKGERGLVTRPDGKLIKASEARWGKRAGEVFLVELTVCANVRRAAEAAGFSTAAVYKRRLKDRHFAAAWDAAIETGKARVQAMLVEAASRTFDPDELPIGDGRELPRVSVGEAINIARLKGPGGEAPPPTPPAEQIASPKEAEAALIKRLKVFAGRVQHDKLAEGWSLHEGELIPPGWVRAEEARCAACGKRLTSTSFSA